jgi:hypothetical protein
MPAPADWTLGLEPRSLAEAKDLSAVLFASRHLSGYGSAPGVFTTILAGRELGMPAMVALRAFHIIEGKPAMAADAIRARVLGSDKCEYFRCTERTPERATFVGKRKGDPEVSMSYTIEEGRQAWTGKRDAQGNPDPDAWSKSGYGKNPADLLVARCSSKLARLLWPDVVHGFYAPSEMNDFSGAM